MILFPAQLLAQIISSKQIRIINPFPPGGTTDILSRIISSGLQAIGQASIVESHPGAGGNLGLQIAAKADPDGNTISLQDARFKDKVVVIELMGSWCPNCIDESRFLAPYYKKNKSKGLEVIGLSFEYSDDMKISGPKIKNFIAKIGIPYPIVLAGKPDDSTIEKVLPMLHKINGYPTTFIIDKQGKVREIHTGFSGPGTGVYHTDWIQEFDKTIQALLIEK
jgi:thiol-disulfide isomerase/thioredoxin